MFFLFYIFSRTMYKPDRMHQCERCGKRFPTKNKLTKHVHHMHGERQACDFPGCTWACSRYDNYRLRDHQRRVHGNKVFIPAATPRQDHVVPSIIVRPTSNHAITRPNHTITRPQTPLQYWMTRPEERWRPWTPPCQISLSFFGTHQGCHLQ